MEARFEVEKFDGKGDFVVWKMKMKALLVQQKHLLETTTTTMGKDRVQEMDEIAYSTVILHLEDNVLRLVSDVESIEELWERLEQPYSTKSFREKLYLKERFFGYKMDPAKNLEENLEEFMKIARDLSRIGAEISDENQAVILLNSLPNMFSEVKESLVDGIRDSLSVGMVMDALRAKDMEMKEKSKDGIERSRKCHHCQEEGHLRRNCPTRKSKEWLLSTRHTSHMTMNKDYLFDFIPTEETIVTGCNEEFIVKSIGSVKIKTHDGQIRTLSNVKYVTNLIINGISVGVLAGNGCMIEAAQGAMKVYKDSSLVMKARVVNGIFILEGSAIKQ